MNRKTEISIMAALSLLLIFSFILLTGCSARDDIVKTGIEVEPSAPRAVTEETKARASEVIRPLISLYFEDKKNKPDGDELMAIGDRVIDFTLGEGLGDREYRHFLGVLDEHGAELVGAVAGDLGEANADALLTLIGRIYFELTEELAPEYIGAVAYETVMMHYDRKIEALIASGKTVDKVLAEQLGNERASLTDNIGKESFSELMKLTFSLRGFFAGGGLNIEAAEQFSDSELLIFLKRLSFNKICINADGYALLRSYYAKYLLSETYIDKLINAVGEDTDIYVSMTALPSLLTSITAALTPEDVGLMRAGKARELTASVFGKFTAEDWELFESITDIEITSKSYNDIAERLYGEDFAGYMSSTEARSLDDVKAAVGGTDFCDVLEGYIFGICPAFSYAMHADMNKT